MLGWKPTVTLEEGLKKTVEFFKNKHQQVSVNTDLPKKI